MSSKVVLYSVKRFFSEVFKRHTEDDAEQIVIVGVVAVSFAVLVFVFAFNVFCIINFHTALRACVLIVDSLDAKDGCLIGESADLALTHKNLSAEESDMQTIPTHYELKLDIFYTKDQRKSAGGNSVMKPENKDALMNNFGIRFCTIGEHAKLVVSENVVC